MPDLDVVSEITNNLNGGEEVQLTLVGDTFTSDTSIVANALQSQIETGRLFSRTLLNRSSRAATSSRGVRVVQLNASTTSSAKSGSVSSDADYQTTPVVENHQKPIVSAWVSGLGSFTDTDATQTATGYEANTGGFAYGLESLSKHSDYTLLLGGSIGYARTDVSSGFSSADVETTQFGVYGSIERAGAELSGAFSYGVQEFDTDRVIPIGADVATASADADGDLFSFAIEGSYDLAEQLSLSHAFNHRLQLVAGFQYGRVELDDFTETGAGILNQSFFDDSFSRSFFSIGVSTEASFALSNGIAIHPHLDLRYERAFGDENTVSSSNIASVAGTAFTGPGADESRNRFALQTGVAIALNDSLSVNFDYQGTFSDTSQNHSIQGGVSYRF